MNAQREVWIRNRRDEIDKAHGEVTELLDGAKISSKTRVAIDLALEEYLTNIVSYAYNDQAEHFIVVRMARNRGQFDLEIEDDGRQFNPLEMPPVDTSLSLDQKPIGGLGIHMIRKVMDAVAYEYRNGRNILRMSKRLD